MTNNTTADTTAKGDQWALLVKGQEILPGDQMLCDDAEMWVTLASPEGEIFDPSKHLPVRRKRSSIAREGVVVRYKHGEWNGLMTPDPAGYFVRAEDYDTLRAQLEAAEAEKREAWAAVESKAGWEWKKRAEAAEADAARLRGINNDLCRIHNARLVDAAKSEARTKALEAEAERLGAVLDRIAGYTLSQFAGPCDMVVQCVHDAMAARTKEAAP